MDENWNIYHSDFGTWGTPATWVSPSIDMINPASHRVIFGIRWLNVAITWFLRTSNSEQFVFYDDITADYRAVDPLWVDPVLGDPDTSHQVSLINTPGKFLRIGWSASSFIFGSSHLCVNLAIERYSGY